VQGLGKHAGRSCEPVSFAISRTLLRSWETHRRVRILWVKAGIGE
jgi:hypothetical protein